MPNLYHQIKEERGGRGRPHTNFFALIKYGNVHKEKWLQPWQSRARVAKSIGNIQICPLVDVRKISDSLKFFANFKKSQEFHFLNLGNGNPAAGINKCERMPICHSLLPVRPCLILCKGCKAQNILV